MSQATAQTPIKDKAYYAATVKEQQLVYTGKKDEEIPTLILTCGLKGQLVNKFDPSKGLLEAPSIDVDVMLRFDPYGNMDSVLDDLEKLGFVGEDLDLLNPDAKKHHSFVGQDVFVSPSRKMRQDEEVIYWNFRFPVKRENKKLSKGEMGKSEIGAAFRERMKQRQAELAAGGDTPF